MKYCSKCGKEIHDEAVICVHCGCAVAGARQPRPRREPVKDKANIGLCIVSALIPLFGFIYGGINYRRAPKMASACLGTAIGAFGIYLAILMVAA